MRIEFRERAVDDVRAAIDWYNARRELLGQEFVEELNVFLRKTAENPRRFQFVEEPVRRALMRRFPFSIYYLTEGGKLIVLASGTQGNNRTRGEGAPNQQ